MMNVAQRLNVWNGPHELVSEALELLEHLEHLKPNQSDNVLNRAQRLNGWNHWNGPIPCSEFGIPLPERFRTYIESS
jgi:hypothetical protein